MPPLSEAVQALVRWAVADGDSRQQPFAIVDKLGARIHVYAASGRLVGSAPVLVGQTRGDASVPGVGERVGTGVPIAQRTTPAGRFASEPGRNFDGEAVVWFDYDAALALHRLRPAPAGERRAERLASATPQDNRITLGCVIVDGRFYDEAVAPLLGLRRGVIYVLPDTGDWRTVFKDAAAAF